MRPSRDKFQIDWEESRSHISSYPRKCGNLFEHSSFMQLRSRTAIVQKGKYLYLVLLLPSAAKRCVCVWERTEVIPKMSVVDPMLPIEVTEASPSVPLSLNFKLAMLSSTAQAVVASDSSAVVLTPVQSSYKDISNLLCLLDAHGRSENVLEAMIQP